MSRFARTTIENTARHKLLPDTAFPKPDMAYTNRVTRIRISYSVHSFCLHTYSVIHFRLKAHSRMQRTAIAPIKDPGFPGRENAFGSSYLYLRNHGRNVRRQFLRWHFREN